MFGGELWVVETWRGQESEGRGGGAASPGGWRKEQEQEEEETPADLPPSEPACRVWWGESVRKWPGKTEVDIGGKFSWLLNELESKDNLFRLHTKERKSSEQIWKLQEILET